MYTIHHILKHRARIAPSSQWRCEFRPGNTCRWTRHPHDQPPTSGWPPRNARKEGHHNGERLFARHSRHND